MSGRHPVSPRRQRSARRPNPPRRTRYPRYREPLPPGVSSGCMVGDLLVPLLGAHRVLTIAAAGGLLPYLATRAGRFAARLGRLASTA